NTNVCDGLWHHAVFTLDSSMNKAKLYLDNICIDSTSLGTYAGFSGNNVLGLGTFLNKNGVPDGGSSDGNPLPPSCYKGNIDDLKIYSKGLSKTEVDTLYNEQPVASVRELSKIQFQVSVH
ncbi:LamG-like jellyroll fold domain-containing protein, partial [uncultured Maritalea sp.]|uniref:LamG-like jellyroll fold domain-containing protein n=1 Tax=uncultured Maritalea sp. TaxID=757249 RepID=UPI00262500A8